MDSTASTNPDCQSLGINDLPKDIGVMLLSVGVAGLLLPGLTGAPAFIAGGMVLWPKQFSGLENWVRRRYPRAYGRGMQQVGRFLTDLNRRFPEGPEK